MGKVRIAIVGMGNCASSLIRGIEYQEVWDSRYVLPERSRQPSEGIFEPMDEEKYQWPSSC